jgi:hypothetical protein
LFFLTLKSIVPRDKKSNTMIQSYVFLRKKQFSGLENIFSKFDNLFSRLGYIFSRLENNYLCRSKEFYP